MITVVNKYKESNHIYCGRGTALGNPFPMHNESQRDGVCDEYEKYFDHQVNELQNPDMLAELRLIYSAARKGDINLGCFCAPKRCHCDTIKAFIDGFNIPEPILGFREPPHNFLSNMYILPTPIVVDGISYHSTENLYQAMKTEDREQRHIISCLSPYKAKRHAKNMDIRKDWNDMRIELMVQATALKYELPTLRAMLIETGTAYIEETNHWKDTFWGVCRGVGENRLGHILMAERSRLHKDSHEHRTH